MIEMDDIRYKKIQALDSAEIEFIMNNRGNPRLNCDISSITTNDEENWRQNWAQEFARLKKIWSLDNKLQSVPSCHRTTIPIYKCLQEDQKIAITSPCRLKKLLQIIFPMETLDPSEWRLELIRKSNENDYISIKNGYCNCLGVTKENLKKNNEKFTEKPFELYTQYLQITPRPSLENISSTRRNAICINDIYISESPKHEEPSTQLQRLAQPNSGLAKNADSVQVFNYKENDKRVNSLQEKERKSNPCNYFKKACKVDSVEKLRTKNCKADRLKKSGKLIAPNNTPVSNDFVIENVLIANKSCNKIHLKQDKNSLESNGTDRIKKKKLPKKNIRNDENIKKNPEKIDNTSILTNNRSLNRTLSYYKSINEAYIKEDADKLLKKKEGRSQFRKLIERIVDFTENLQQASSSEINKDKLPARPKTEGGYARRRDEHITNKKGWKKVLPVINVRENSSLASNVYHSSHTKPDSDATVQSFTKKNKVNQISWDGKQQKRSTSSEIFAQCADKNDDFQAKTDSTKKNHEIRTFNKEEEYLYNPVKKSNDFKSEPVTSSYQQKHTNTKQKYYQRDAQGSNHRDIIKKKKYIRSSSTLADYARPNAPKSKIKPSSLSHIKNSLLNPLDRDLLMPAPRQRESRTEYKGTPFKDVHNYSKTKRQKGGESTSSVELFYQCDSKLH